MQLQASVISITILKEKNHCNYLVARSGLDMRAERLEVA